MLGVCGGYQMLCESLEDPGGVEGNQASMRGMGLLPGRTVFSAEKTRTNRKASVVSGPFRGAALEGYEIHMGDTSAQEAPFCILEDGRSDGCQRGTVFGTYLHGLFDTGELTVKLAAWLCERKGISPGDAAPLSHRAYQETQYNRLAEGVRQSVNLPEIYRILEESERG